MHMMLCLCMSFTFDITSCQDGNEPCDTDKQSQLKATEGRRKENIIMRPIISCMYSAGLTEAL